MLGCARVNDPRGPREPLISATWFEELIRTQMDLGMDFSFRVEELSWGRAVLRLAASERHLRPGGTISGPILFTFADTALYAAVLSCVGEHPLTVTTDMTINFLRRAPQGELIAEANIHKPGRTLLFGAISIRSEARDGVICHATGTYARPPGPSRA